MTGEQKSIDALRQLPLMKSPLKRHGFTSRSRRYSARSKDETELAYVNAHNHAGVHQKTSDNVLEVANKANAIFEQAKKRLPAGTEIQVMESGAVFIEGTINNLTNTAMTGGALVSLIVFLFLRRLSNPDHR